MTHKEIRKTAHGYSVIAERPSSEGYNLGFNVILAHIPELSEYVTWVEFDGSSHWGHYHSYSNGPEEKVFQRALTDFLSR